MFSINRMRSAVTLAVIAGLLAVAAPAGAQRGGADFTKLADKAPAVVTMLDYEGTPVVTIRAPRDVAKPTGEIVTDNKDPDKLNLATADGDREV